ncbi:MAG: beta-ketoacyl synthase chain length factor [Bacteroidales bacterium]
MAIYSVLSSSAYYSKQREESIQDPAFAERIPLRAMRRMSRIVKLGLFSCLETIDQAQISEPGIIVSGTGFGCIDQTYQFLSKLYTSDKEDLLPPAPFMQSTHNTVSGAIALYLKNHAYNNVITHDSLAFELALEDAIFALEDEDEQYALLFAIDELTPELKQLKSELDKKFSLPNSLGEGCFSFILAKGESNNALAEICYNKIYACSFIEEKENLKTLIQKYNIDTIIQNNTAIKQEDVSDLGVNVIKVSEECHFFPSSGGYGLTKALELFKQQQGVCNVIIYHKSFGNLSSIIVVRKGRNI